jgi:hypothetical protein
MTTAYRISRWVELPSQLKGVRFRKVLTAMSVSAIDARWMSTQAQLSPQEQSALLQQLRHEGALTEVTLPTLDVGVEPFFVQPQHRRRHGLLAHMQAWLLERGPVSR